MNRLAPLVPEVVLPPAQIEALNGVDLQLHFGNHAVHDATAEHGWMELTVEDVDYAGMKVMVNGLKAARGDVFAREGLGFSKDWDCQSYLDTLLNWTLAGSPYVQPQVRDTVSLPLQTGRLSDDDKQAFLQGFESFRKFRLVNPIDYASVLATMKGVACHYAGPTNLEENEWQHKAERVVLESPKFMQIFLSLGLIGVEGKFQDTKTVSSLGKLASTMDASATEKPVLSYAGGGYHRSNIEKLFNRLGVSFQSHAFSPDRTWRYRADRLSNLVGLAIPALHSQERYRRAWVANAQQELAKN